MAVNPLFEGIAESPQTFDSNLFEADLEQIPLKPLPKGPDLIKEMTPPPDTSLTGRLGSWMGSLIDIKQFRPSFDITQDTLVERLKISLWPFQTQKVFGSSGYDLYGPVWILLTLIVLTNMLGNAI